MPSQKIFLPPSTLGMLGGGQLGRMFALAAKQMGYRVITLDKTPHSPMGQVCDEQIVGDLDDPDALERLGDKSNILTYEFEHIDVGCVEMLEEKGKIVRPSSNVLKITQHRLFEKEFIVHAGLRVADYAKVESNTEFDAACAKIGFPAVLKTVHGGYDGKGQCIVRDKSQALKVFNAMKRHPLVWEKKIPFLKELSIIAARDAEGNVVVYPVSENMHIDNILDTAIVPARISRRAQNTARKIAETVALHLDIVGVFCVEMFLLEKDEILVNEIAPRPHNSGHYTINACPVSQFEQQLRAICGLSLGLPLLQNPAVMVNVLGTGKGNRLIGVDKMLGDPRIHFHLYGKEEAKTKRKMGHITAVAKSVEEALEAAEAARRKLRWAGSL